MDDNFASSVGPLRLSFRATPLKAKETLCVARRDMTVSKYLDCLRYTPLARPRASGHHN